MKFEPLKIITQEEAISRANRKIYKYMMESHPGLKCRWPIINSAVGGYFRFGEIITLCGASGSGKSYILNMLREDFAGELNKNFPYPFKILSFSFEMGAADEVIRTYAGKLNTNYSTLLSAFHRLNSDEYKRVIEVSKLTSNDKIHYVESTGNHLQIYDTVYSFHQQYPEHQLVITLDHTLLADYFNEANEVELVSNISKLSIRLKKDFNALVIFIGQLNDKIEQSERIQVDVLHYPTKKDIHGSKSVYMSSDTVAIIHRPELLGITQYGIRKLATKDLIMWHFLKSRLYGTEGIIPMKQDFSHGNLIYPYTSETNQQTLFNNG
jgi:replicative DNA helicase